VPRPHRPRRPRAPHIEASLREEERVTPLELFFDLVFVLAITQCTALMAAHPTWETVAQGVLILGILWWAWVGYSWLTSVLDPEEGAVRLVMFAAMAALLFISLCIPGAFGGLAFEFTIGYAAVRAAHIGLFLIASRGDPGLRQSIIGFTVSTVIGVTILFVAATTDGELQLALWAAALLLDMAGPFVSGAEGWKIVPGHFAERHGLIIIIALGESIVAIGAGASGEVDWGVAAAAVLGMALAAGMWWVYFDIVALVSARRLIEAPPGPVQNALARDSYSYIHFPMVAGIVLVALGLKKVLGHVGEELDWVPAFALLGGVATYLLGLVAFRWRHVHTLNRQRLALAVLCLAAIPLAVDVPPLLLLTGLAALMSVMIAYETRIYGEGRGRVRHELGAVSRPRDVE
jgi:low temperature requirement protein LtrA